MQYTHFTVEEREKIQAEQQLLKQNPTNEDLCYIIEYVEPLREQAKKISKKNKRRNSARNKKTLSL